MLPLSLQVETEPPGRLPPAPGSHRDGLGCASLSPAIAGSRQATFASRLPKSDGPLCLFSVGSSTAQTQVCLRPLLTMVQQNLPTATFQHRELNICEELGESGEPLSILAPIKPGGLPGAVRPRGHPLHVEPCFEFFRSQNAPTCSVCTQPLCLSLHRAETVSPVRRRLCSRVAVVDLYISLERPSTPEQCSSLDDFSAPRRPHTTGSKGHELKVLQEKSARWQQTVNVLFWSGDAVRDGCRLALANR